MGIGQLIVLVLYIFGWVIVVKTFRDEWECEEWTGWFIVIHFAALLIFVILGIAATWNTPIF